MNCGKTKVMLALWVGLATTVALLFSLSTLRARAATPAVDGAAGSGPVTLRRYKPPAFATSRANIQRPIAWGHQNAGGDPEACTIAIATGSSTSPTVEGRPVLWKNRDYFGRPDAWQANLFWHKATSLTFSASDLFSDRFSYVAVSDRGDLSDPQDDTETLYYPRMGANERGLAVVSAEAHTLASDIQSNTVGSSSQDPRGIRNGGLNHWILSRCETITEVQQLLTATNGGGGYNGSSARNTASLIAVIDRFGGAAIFEVDGSTFARENITKEFTTLDERPHSSGPPPGGYSGFDYRTNFSRIDFTNTNICSATFCFPYFPDSNTDGVNDLEYSTSSVERWGRVAARIDDGPKDHQYFVQKWVGAYGHPRENYLETVARSVGYAPYLSSSSEFAWTQEKLVGNHLNRFVTVSSVVIVGSKADDKDEGRLTTMWVALGEPSVAIFVPVFPYAGEPPAVLDDFFLSVNAKRRLVYDYGTDGKYPVDNIDPDSPYSSLRNADHSIDLSMLFGGNYYGEGGLQAYNFAIEEELYKAYQSRMNEWRAPPTVTQLTPAMLASWQMTMTNWAVGGYIKSDPIIIVYEAETGFGDTCAQITTTNGITACHFSENGYISRTHDFTGPMIIEVIAKGTPDSGDWPGMRVWLSDTAGHRTCLTEVGGETEGDCTVVVSPAHATNKAKSVSSDLVSVTSRFALYRYRTIFTGTAELRIEVISATASAWVAVDKVLLRAEPRSVEMYEVEKDWDAIRDTCVRVDDYSILLTDTAGYFDIYHYVWGVPLTIEVVARGYSTNPSPVLELRCNSQLVGTATLTTEYEVYAFDWDPGSEGQAACRVQPGNYKDIRVDKLLVKESLPVKSNTAPVGCFTVDIARVAPFGFTPITATAMVTDPDGDTITSYFWDFGDGEGYCSGNPVVRHTYRFPDTPARLTLYVTDHRGRTAVIRWCIYLPIVTRSYKPS